ncbi:MAG: superinfection immunity protein [Candidatus Adiutrix sp.]|jgi:uncharacterized membrane protein|nr:superinfection immunity protein [Candidatus Adiutrix sp.]
MKKITGLFCLILFCMINTNAYASQTLCVAEEIEGAFLFYGSNKGRYDYYDYELDKSTFISFVWDIDKNGNLDIIYQNDYVQSLYIVNSKMLTTTRGDDITLYCDSDFFNMNAVNAARQSAASSSPETAVTAPETAVTAPDASSVKRALDNIRRRNEQRDAQALAEQRREANNIDAWFIIKIIILICIILAIYFIPYSVAKSRHHNGKTAILVVNLLFGWSVIMWIVCLVWACNGNVNREEIAKQKEETDKAAKEFKEAMNGLRLSNLKKDWEYSKLSQEEKDIYDAKIKAEEEAKLAEAEKEAAALLAKKKLEDEIEAKLKEVEDLKKKLNK